ncbi:hypothetical protein DKG71_31530 [Streptomyces sp. NEAU-S7GS2]|nr:hypothetical protein DKG71_31530 [Streptomyces sp. NEAU-S7GS2]
MPAHPTSSHRRDQRIYTITRTLQPPCKTANRAFRSITELCDAIDKALRYVKNQENLLVGFLAGTGLPHQARS